MLSHSQKTVIRVLSVFVALTWVVVGLFNGWPLWLWASLAVVTLIVPSLIAFALVERVLRRDVHQEIPGDAVVEASPPPPPPSPEPPAQPHQYTVDNVLLRSSNVDYQFLFSCVVFWRPRRDAPGIPHANPGALAADMILEIAADIAASAAPDDSTRTRYRMVNVLGALHQDRTGRVEAWADRISLALADKDAARLKRLAEVRKDEEVWEHERSYERNVRTYLSEEVLTSPANALVWWLAGPRTGEKDRVDEAVEKIDNLRKLTSAADPHRENPPPESPQWHHPGAHMPELSYVPAELLSGDNGVQDGMTLHGHAIRLVENTPDGPQRVLFARRLADALTAHGHDEVGEQLRRRFDASADVPGDPELSSGQSPQVPGGE